MSDESKSPEAEANAATAARGVQAALFAARTQAEANAVIILIIIIIIFP